jgi:DNA-binding transcriptional MerR regulator
MNGELRFLTSEEAAKMLGITRQALSYRVKKKKIKPADNVKCKYKLFTEEEVHRSMREK